MAFFSAVHRLRDWQFFLAVHCVFAGVALAPFLLGVGLFSGIGLGHTYAFFGLDTFQNLFSGEVFMNRLNMNGFPSFVPVGFSLNPFSYLFTALFPPFTDLHWFVFATLVAGGWSSALFLRKLGFSREGSTIGSLSYLTGCWWLVVTADYIPFMPILPIAGLILLHSRTHFRWACVFGSLLVGYVWLGINTQVSLMLFTAFGAGAAVMSIREFKKGWQIAIRPLVLLFVSIVFGTIIGLPKVLSSLVYGNLSWRAGGIPLTEATASGLQPLTIVTYLFPYASFPFLNFGGELLQVFIGVFGLCFLIVGVYLAFSRSSSLSLRWWVGAYAFVLLLAFHRSPLAALLHSFPPFSYFRGAGRWTMLAGFAVAPIVAAGLDALVSGNAERIRKKLTFFFGWLSIILIFVCITGQLALIFFSDQLITFFKEYFAHFHEALKLDTPLSYYEAFVERRVQELAASPLFLQPRALFPLISIFTIGFLLQEKIWHRLRDKGMTLVCACLITTALTLVWYDKFIPRGALPDTHPTQEFFASHPGNVLNVFSNVPLSELRPDTRLSAEDAVQWTVANMMPNSNLLYGVSSLDYFDTIAARRPTALAAWVGAQWVQAPQQYRLAVQPMPTEDKIAELARRRDVLNIQAVRYLTSPFPLPSPFRLVSEIRVTSASLPLFIYENPSARPLLYFAFSLRTIAENETKAFEMITEDSWPGRTSLLECEPTCELSTVTGQGTINILEDRATRLTLETNAETPQWLIVTINRLPGWVVSIDGEPTNSVYANGSYFGIRIPKGTHTVTLRFSLAELFREGIRELF